MHTRRRHARTGLAQRVRLCMPSRGKAAAYVLIDPTTAICLWHCFHKLSADGGATKLVKYKGQLRGQRSGWALRFFAFYPCSISANRNTTRPFHQRIPVGSLWLDDVACLLLFGSGFDRSFRSGKATDSQEGRDASGPGPASDWCSVSRGQHPPDPRRFLV
jgi:hypothetical protein